MKFLIFFTNYSQAAFEAYFQNGAESSMSDMVDDLKHFLIDDDFQKRNLEKRIV